MNKRELKILNELLSQGYEVYHKGYPDFIAYHPETEEVRFVEVKRQQRRPTPKMGLSKHQERVIEILRKIARVDVSYIS